MKLVNHAIDGRIACGVVRDDAIVDLGCDAAALFETLRKDGVEELERAAARRLPGRPLSDARLLPPLAPACKIICVGLNYRSHIEEMGRELPKHPMLFTRFRETLVGAEEALIRPKESNTLDFEGELAVVIGRDGRRIAREDAYAHVAGYTCFNDGSIREYQRHTTQVTAGKNFWRSGAMGPWMTTADEIANPEALKLETRLNGEVMQSTTTADLYFSVPDLVAYISTIIPLAAGDIIATGTTGGVGAAREPQLWMKPGDRIEVEIEGVGLLRNTVVDEVG